MDVPFEYHIGDTKKQQNPTAATESKIQIKINVISKSLKTSLQKNKLQNASVELTNNKNPIFLSNLTPSINFPNKTKKINTIGFREDRVVSCYKTSLFNFNNSDKNKHKNQYRYINVSIIRSSVEIFKKRNNIMSLKENTYLCAANEYFAEINDLPFFRTPR